MEMWPLLIGYGELADKYDAMVMVDECHSAGVVE